MLDAYAHGKALGLGPGAGTYRQLEAIACTVAGGEHHGVTSDAGTLLLGMCEVANLNANDAAPPACVELDQQFLDSGVEAHLGSRSGQSPTQALDHLWKFVRAHMRSPTAEDARVGAVGHQQLEHTAHGVLIARAGVQLAVRVGPRPALAEAIVAVGVDAQAAMDPRQRNAARVHVTPAVEDGHPQSRGQRVEGAVQASSSLKRRTSSSKIVPIAWLSRPGCLIDPSPWRTGWGLRFTSGERNFSISVPRASALDRRGIWFRNSNFSRMSWTFGEKPSRYASKSALSCCWLERALRSRSVNFAMCCRKTDQRPDAVPSPGG